jgi:hypothetical protein
MDMSQLLRALGLQQAYQSYQQNIGQPFANVAGPFGRGLLGLDRPEYGEEQAYRTGQALGNMPAIGAPVGAFKAAMQAPEAIGAVAAITPKVAQKVANALTGQQLAHEIARQNAVKMLGLSETNTAMDRAKAMGFVDDYYHGTNKEFDAFDINKSGAKTGNPNAVLGSFLTPNPQEASRYAEAWGKEGGNVLRLLIRPGQQYSMPFRELDEMAMLPYKKMMADPSFDPNKTVKFGDMKAQKAAAEQLGKFREEAIKDIIRKRKDLIESGYQSIVVNMGKPTQETIIFDPSRIRSRFAAFDPARMHENNLLATLAAMGIGVPVVAGLLGDQTE